MADPTMSSAAACFLRFTSAASIHAIAAARQARSNRPVVVISQSGVRTRRLLGLVLLLANLVAATNAADQTAGCGTYSGTLSRIPADRAPDHADDSALSRAGQHAPLRRLSRRRIR